MFAYLLFHKNLLLKLVGDKEKLPLMLGFYTKNEQQLNEELM